MPRSHSSHGRASSSFHHSSHTNPASERHTHQRVVSFVHLLFFSAKRLNHCSLMWPRPCWRWSSPRPNPPSAGFLVAAWSLGVCFSWPEASALQGFCRGGPPLETTENHWGPLGTIVGYHPSHLHRLPDTVPGYFGMYLRAQLSRPAVLASCQIVACQQLISSLQQLTTVISTSN